MWRLARYRYPSSDFVPKTEAARRENNPIFTKALGRAEENLGAYRLDGGRR